MTSEMKPKPGLLRASSLLFVITIVTNLCNYLFHAIASRSLGPADYGALVSMLALLIAIAIPSQAIQIVIAKTVATEELTGRFDRIASLVYHAVIRALLLGGVIWLLLVLSSGFWAKFLQLESVAPIIAVGFAGMLWLLLPIVRGALQGFQQFNHLGFNMLTDGVLRLAIGSLFFWLGMRVVGGVYAGAIASTLACLLASIPLRRLRGHAIIKAAELELPKLYRFAVPVVLALGGFMLLSSLDMIMVKHYFIPEEAGYYSAGSLVGKAFLFLPFAVAQVLFPKVTAGKARSENTRILLEKSLGITAGILLLGVAVAWVLAPYIIMTLFGKLFLNEPTLFLVRGFGIAVAPLALVYILLQYNIAVQNRWFVMVLLMNVPLFLLGLVMFHASLQQVLTVVGVNHAVVFIAGYCITPRQKHD
jgi:O-antigen/teichoic acid export membrane protein